MDNKYKEYISVVILSLCQGSFTYEFLGGMPYIAFGIFSKTTISAFVMWMIYGLILYLITQKWIVQVDITGRYFAIAIAFGLGTALFKEGLDLGVEKLRGLSASVIKIVCTDQITTFFWGILLISFLFFVVARRKINFNAKRIRVPLCILITIVLCYGVLITNYLRLNQIAIREYNATKEQIRNLDYHFGMKILDINVWFYMAFYIVFWWFMRRLTEKKEEFIDAASLKKR